MDEPPEPARRARALPLVRAQAVLEAPHDVIVIGAGLGGLVAAVLLARAGLRVLVLERHYALGGLTQTFRRRRFSFEVGVHYVGDVGPTGILGRLFSILAGAPFAFVRLPDRHDRLLGGGLDVRLGGELRARVAQLESLPGAERRALEAWHADVLYAAREAALGAMRRATAGPPLPETGARTPFLRLADETLAEALGRRIASPELRLALARVWTNYACSPEVASFATHAATEAHYFAGAWVPAHGGDALAQALARALEARGGHVVVRAAVEALRVEGERVAGVRLAGGRELRAPVVLSDAGAAPTFRELLPDAAPFKAELCARVESIGASEGHVAVYLGLGAAAQSLGLDGSNQFVLDVPPEGALAASAAWARGEREAPGALFVGTAAGVPAPWSARYPARSALSAGVIVPTAAFSDWAGTAHARRGEAYEALKARLGASVVRAVERALPAVRGVIESVEVSTPLSTDHFAGRGGSFAGLSGSPRRFRLPVGPATPIRGLYLTGQDVWTTGVGGAALGGLAAASAVLGRDLGRDIFLGGAR